MLSTIVNESIANRTPPIVYSDYQESKKEVAFVSTILASTFARYHTRRINDYPFLPVFPGDELEDDVVAPEEGEVERDYELPLDHWHAIPALEPGSDMPRRFVDGTIVARTVGALTDAQGRERPLLMAIVGAAALELEDRNLVRRPHDYEMDTVLAIIAKGMRRDDLDLIAGEMTLLGVRILELPARSLSTDFELARTHTFDGARDEMLEAERRLVVSCLDRSTLVDGLLEDRLEGLDSWDVPVVGVVKRLLRIRNHLHQAGMNLVYSLKPGERTPAIVLQTHPRPYTFRSVLSWFLRLHGGDDVAPSWGVVRVSLPLEYFEGSLGGDFETISRLSGWLYALRCRDRSYQRMPVSLEPIVRVEEHMRALRPSLDAAIGRFQAAAQL